MAALTIRVAGVDIVDYVPQESIRVESSGSALAATCEFKVEDKLGELAWIELAEKSEVLIDDGATRLFGGWVNIIEDEHDGPFRVFTVRGSDYTVQLEEHICVNSFFEAGTSDSAMIAAIFAAWCVPIDGVTHVDTLEAAMAEMHFASITVREALDHICRKTGGMYYVDFYQRLHYFSADEGLAAPVGLSTEPDSVTLFPYSRFRRRRDSSDLCNNVLVVGNGLTVWREDAASIAHYGGKRYQAVVRDSNINTEEQAERYGDWYLALHAWAAYEPRLRCWIPGLRAGMNIRLVNSVHNIDYSYSIRRAILRCTGGYEPGNPQYYVDLRLGYRDQPGRPDFPSLPDVPHYPPAPPPYEPPKEGNWIQKVYIATATHGVFYTDGFVTDTDYIHGVPVWTAINTGLNLAFQCLGFRGDAFHPESRQYCLMEDALYRREDGGNWVSILTLAQAVAITGGDVALSSFGRNGLNCNINREGWVGVLFNTVNMAHSHVKLALIYSTDFGATWNESIIEDWNISTRGRTFSLTVGAYIGTSPYPAGQVMYCGVDATPRLAITLDGGATWNYGAILGAASYTCHILVDPNDQSRVFVGGRDGAGPWHVTVSLDHGATINDYDLNGSEPMGDTSVGATYYHLSVAMDERKTVRVGAQALLAQHLHTTRDDGGSWQEPTPQHSADHLGISLVQTAPDFLYLLRQWSGGVVSPPESCHVVFASEDEGQTMVPKAGANACTADTGGGDSIPYNCGGVRGILEVWTDPDLPPLGRLPGQITWPQIEPNVGTGAQQVAAGSHHGQHEKGGADEIDVTDLSGVLADEQDAGWLKGRVISAAAPDDGDVYVWDAITGEWRPEEAPELEGTHLHIYKENKSAECNGVKVTFLTANQFEPETLRVFHQRDEEIDGVAEDYVELGTFDGFTMAAAPAGGEKLIVHYLAELV